MQTICAIPIREVQRGELFVTLTYPGTYAGDWHRWKDHLRAFWMRLHRRCPRAAFVWKLEPQTRGAPHFHLLVVGVPFLAKDWLSRAWYEVVASGDQRHLRAGTQVQQVKSHRGVVAYAAKYTAKRQQLPANWQDGVGRWWGVYGRANLGILWLEWPLTQRQFFAGCRALRGLLLRRQSRTGRHAPRAAPGGMWAVVRSDDAYRLAVHLAD